VHGRGQRWLCVPLVILEDKEFELAVGFVWWSLAAARSADSVVCRIEGLSTRAFGEL